MLCQETSDQRAQVHVTVCVCTFRRPQLLQRGLMALQRMDTKGEFTFSIVVADNDSNQSARTVVEECAKTATIDIAYCVETQQNIALARNQAIRRGRGEFVAFIDDDEWPSEQWLSLMLKTCETCHADGYSDRFYRISTKFPQHGSCQGVSGSVNATSQATS